MSEECTSEECSKKGLSVEDTRLYNGKVFCIECFLKKTRWLKEGDIDNTDVPLDGKWHDI